MPQLNWQIITTVLLSAAIIFSVVRLARCKISLSLKITLALLRTALLCALMIAVWEPTIKFERFENSRMKIPVIIDVSLSMQNFSPNENVFPFLDTLLALENETNGRVSFEYLIFGDSLRTSNKNFNALTFNDNKSYFPTTQKIASDDSFSDVIIISDGYFSRPRRASEIFPMARVHYLTLPDATPNPFVTVSHNAPSSTPSDSAFFVEITASGFARENSALSITLKNNSRTIHTRQLNVEAGYFEEEIKVRTSNSRAGRSLYTIEVSADTTSPPVVSSFVHQTTPHFLTYSIYTANHTLDRRYVSNALAANNFFRERRQSPHVLFLFDWDSTAAGLARALPRTSASVFIGSLPCSTSSVSAPSINVRVNDLDNNILNTAAFLRNMAPPQEILSCRRLPITQMKQMLSATINQTSGQPSVQTSAQQSTQTSSNNLPILFSGRFMARQSIFVPVRGIWRWDFWPMSLDRAESEIFAFSNMLLSLTKEMLLDNISDQFILYPKTTLVENDSVRFMMSLPSAVPIFENAKLSVQIKSDSVNIDTLINYLPQGSNDQPLTFAPLPHGKYSISATLDAAGTKSTARDSFTINKDMSELSIVSQNTRFFQDFAIPIDINDHNNLRQIFNIWQEQSNTRRTVTDAIRLHRSWLLLLLVLALFLAELVLRKVKGLD